MLTNDQKEQIKKLYVDRELSYSNLWTIMFSVNDSIKLYNYMYNDATIFLKRKKEKFDQFIQMRRSETIIDAPQNGDEGIVQL